MFVCMGSGKLNGGCDFSWGSPGHNQPSNLDPAIITSGGVRDPGHDTCMRELTLAQDTST